MALKRYLASHLTLEMSMIRPAILAAALLVAPFTAMSAGADEASVSTEYLISIAGLEIGEMAVTYEETGGAYALNLEGGFRFLFISGTAEGRVTGAKEATGFSPDAFRLRFDGPTREVISNIRFDGGRPDVWTILPEPEPEWMEGRIPLADSDMPGAVDPVSAFLVPANNAAEACTRQQKVFSGFVRFDLTLTPAAAEADGVIPCVVRFKPISGHKVDSNGAPQLRSGQGLQVSMAELTPGVWAPHYLGFKTRIGTLAFERKR